MGNVSALNPDIQGFSTRSQDFSIRDLRDLSQHIIKLNKKSCNSDSQRQIVAVKRIKLIHTIESLSYQSARSIGHKQLFVLLSALDANINTLLAQINNTEVKIAFVELFTLSLGTSPLHYLQTNPSCEEEIKTAILLSLSRR